MKKYNLILLVIIASLLSSCGSSNFYGVIDEYTYDQKTDGIKRDKSTQTMLVPATMASDFIWGINGHTLDSPSYFEDNSLELQFKLLKELQNTYYRVNVFTKEDGEVTFYKNHPKRWEETLRLSEKYDIKILPVFHLKDYDTTMTVDQAYQKAKRKTAGFAKMYHRYFDYYELGNERDNLIIKKKADGVEIEDYNLKQFDVLASYFKGMHEGIKQEDPSAKTMINSAGWKHWGFFEYLKQLEIPYDIISWHWYSNQGMLEGPFTVHSTGEDVLALLYERFNKPIWITEINQHDGTASATQNDQAFWVHNFIKDLSKRPYVEGYFIYELLDQPHLDDGNGWENPKEAYYGIVDWVTPYETYAYKSGFTTYKFNIEASKHGKQNYFKAVYTVLEKTMDTDVQFKSMASTINKESELSIKLDELLSDAVIIMPQTPLEINEDEHTNNIVYFYEKTLNRDATEENIKYWTKKLKKDMAPKEFIKLLLMSKEFYQKAIIEGYEKRTGFPFYRKGTYQLKDQK